MKVPVGQVVFRTKFPAASLQKPFSWFLMLAGAAFRPSVFVLPLTGPLFVRLPQASVVNVSPQLVVSGLLPFVYACVIRLKLS